MSEDKAKHTQARKMGTEISTGIVIKRGLNDDCCNNNKTMIRSARNPLCKI